MLSEDADPVVHAYASTGWWFLALRLDPKRPQQWTQPPPFQVGFPVHSTTLPLQLGALASPDRSDLDLYVLQDGRAALAGSGSEVTVPGTCLFDLPDTDDPDQAAATLWDAWARPDTTSWATFFAAPPGSLADEDGDPLPTLDSWQRRALGYDPDAPLTTTWLRLRAEGAAMGDPTIVLAGSNEPVIERYYAYTWELESRYPLCSTGLTAPDPGVCYSTVWWQARATGHSGTSAVSLSDYRGCRQHHRGLFLPLALGLLRRRR